MANNNINLDRIKRRIVQDADRVVFKAAEYLRDEANKSVPYEEGNLQASSSGVRNAKGMAEGDVAYLVSYDTPYAIRLHEHPEYNFNNGRKGKWLEDAMKNEQDAIRNYIANELKKLFS